MDVIITADIGGTQIRVAVYPANGIKPLRQKRIPTKGKDPAHVRLTGLIAELMHPDENALAIAAAAPGPTDPKLGLVLNAPNIPGWTNLPLAQMLHDQFHLPVYLGNDANVAALGEWRFGAGKGHHDLIYFTISTGIGGGVISDDRLLLGQRGLATELGHVTVDPNGPVCGCGHRGHIEAFSSGTAIARFVAGQLAQGRASTLTAIPQPNAHDVSVAADAGDELAIEALERAGKYMGIAIANYLHIFNPSIVVLGGGVSHSGGHFFIPMRQSLKESVFSPGYLENLTLTTAELGDDMGLLGALALAQTYLNIS
ncbi:MAG TPA: ROK family protein [Anaerolineaceae bacterium]|nr:ROK family protein [Anaerolineaceae bacterium]